MQNVYIGEESDEPEFQYVPEDADGGDDEDGEGGRGGSGVRGAAGMPGTKALAQSMLLLEESLDSGAIIGQFEQVRFKNSYRL